MKKNITFGIAAVLLILASSCAHPGTTYPVVDTITDNSTVYHCATITFSGATFIATNSGGATATFNWNNAPASEGLYQIVTQFATHYDNQVTLDLVTPNGDYDIAPGQTVFAQIKTGSNGKVVMTTTTKILMAKISNSSQIDTVNINATQQ